MYVAVKGGEEAIGNAHKLLAAQRRGDPAVPEIEIEQIGGQLSRAVARVMAEASLYAPREAALAVKQAQGDLIEAVFLLRASRAAWPRFGYSEALDADKMQIKRRISGVWKDLPGGQILGPTFDYSHRLLDASLAEKKEPAQTPTAEPGRERTEAGETEIVFDCPKAMRALSRQGLIEEEPAVAREPLDLTREPLDFPAGRDLRLQNLARADEGFLLSLAYSSQRGFGSVHPFVSELRLGTVKVEIIPPELGFPLAIGEIEITECETVNQFHGGGALKPCFTRGYGLVFGCNERKALSMAIVDRALRAKEFGEEIKGPAQDEEFVMQHSDNIEAAGFVEHIKLPHYVDFQAELSMLKSLRENYRQGGGRDE
ncbi:MAG: carbon-phosphorus lyase complex subunit PhnI [Candidatus Adiutrix sp.]|jgi:alpha-D-ribose 1-methylphosphonate 5-triphosphate synthase subunit PhnI|nr:carbon-phosphorus lyase complex subunit PhnI [Candidatus Adiutrix sp.]